MIFFKIRIFALCFTSTCCVVVVVLTLVLYATSQHLVTLDCEEGARVGGQCAAESVELTVWGRHWHIEPSLRQQLIRETRDRTLRCYATSTMVDIVPNGACTFHEIQVMSLLAFQLPRNKVEYPVPTMRALHHF